MRLGQYLVREGLRLDNPAFPVYLIYKGDDLIGKQFSKPALSDCEWHDRQRGVYASSTNGRGYGHAYSMRSRRGRPRKEVAEQELAEAMDA